jgi:tetratricopeptide (TPR) repeat protein
MLRHLPFFEAIADAERAETGVAAGLVVLRLVDAWMEDAPTLVADGRAGIAAVRATIGEMPPSDPWRGVLESIVGAIERAEPGDVSIVAPRLLAYGRALDFGGSWRLAADVYRTVLDHAHPLADADVATSASLRLGYCARVQGEWQEARLAYEGAERFAAASGDDGAVLRSRIGRANIARDRGNLPEAERMLDDVLASARAAAELADVRRAALHDRSTVAYLRRDLTRAIRLAHEALALTVAGTDRDRLLGDIGTYFAEMGVRGAARDAHLVVATTTQERYQRWSSLLSLMELAVQDGAADAFEAHRRELADAPLPAELAVLRRLYEARGHQRFGRAEEARVAARHALDLAHESGQHRYVFEAESLLGELAAPASIAAGAERSSPADLADIVTELAAMRELAGAA